MGRIMNAKALGKVMVLLYANERNFCIDTFWDGGFRARLGDEQNGWTWDSGIGWYDLDDLAEAMEKAANTPIPLDYKAKYRI